MTEPLKEHDLSDNSPAIVSQRTGKTAGKNGIILLAVFFLIFEITILAELLLHLVNHVASAPGFSLLHALWMPVVAVLLWRPDSRRAGWRLGVLTLTFLCMYGSIRILFRDWEWAVYTPLCSLMLLHACRWSVRRAGDASFRDVKRWVFFPSLFAVALIGMIVLLIASGIIRGH